MADIVLITHRFDKIKQTNGPPNRVRGTYMMVDILNILRGRGHNVILSRTPRRHPIGDVAILHVDASRVPGGYMTAASRYPICVNGRVADIRKRQISTLTLDPSEQWDGQVIVKTDLNSTGAPERAMNRRALRKYRLPPHPFAPPCRPYRVLPSKSAVPASVWRNRRLVVERFLPEREGSLYAMRTYVFCGDASRCVRVTSTHPVVKGDSVVDVYEVDIPPEVVELRRSLNFDYGKFDFVMTPEGPKVFDFNKTPSSVSTSTPELQEIVDIGNETFADALERMVH